MEEYDFELVLNQMTKTWKAYCPLMKGVCINGFVKGQMPESETGERTLCAFFVVLKGKDPQTEQVYDDPGCSFHWLPVLSVETNQMIRHTTASVDKTATEVRKHHATFIGAMPEDLQRNLLKSNPLMIEQKRNGGQNEE